MCTKTHREIRDRFRDPCSTVRVMAGFIRKSNNGKKFRAVWKTQGPAGQWFSESQTFATKGAAERWLAQQTLTYGGSRKSSGDKTVGEFFDEWFEIMRPTWQGSTARLNRTVVDHLITHLGHIRLSRLDTEDLDRWVRKMIANGDGADNIRKRAGKAKQGLDQAVRWKYIPRNPADSMMKLPPKPNREIIPPTKEEAALLLSQSWDHSESFGMFVHLAVATGARRGELLALRWSDVDFDTATLTINKAVGRTYDYDEIIKSTKTGGTRRLSLDPVTMKGLVKYRQSTGQETSNGLIFSRKGQPWKTTTVTSRWKKVRSSAGMNYRFHDLRHFHATLMLTEGADLPTLAGRLGHGGGGRTTLAVYGHWLQSSDRRLADIAGTLFDQMSVDDSDDAPDSEE